MHMYNHGTNNCDLSDAFLSKYRSLKMYLKKILAKKAMYFKEMLYL